MSNTTKRVHLICNAHLDPVWLWRWEEGCAEALSTFRTAAELADEFPGFVFNHNESLLYEWVKENDPVLYEDIREKVKNGKWHIMGGWFLQPDCNMPSGESFVRNILKGRRFFTEEFGERPTTAINFDSFGHSKGLVQVLRQSGYDSYLVCRPAKGNFDFKEQDFLWKGLDGSSIRVHRSDENYNSVWGHVAEEIEKFLGETENEGVSLFLWGVGDHGGGPSRKDLTDLTKFFEERGEQYVFLHSSPEPYFAELEQSGTQLPVVDRGLNPVAPGCYTSQIRVKQKHRQLENELYSLEKMLSSAALQCGLAYPTERLKEAERDLLFSEFHDALPGSGTQLVEEDTLRQLDHGLQIVSEERMKAFAALSAGQPRVIDGTSTVLFYNPHPYEIEGVFDFECGLPKQNWEDVFYYPEVRMNGERIPTQGEMESSHFCIDWRKRVVVRAKLPAGEMSRMDVYWKALPKRPTFPPIAGEPSFTFDNGRMQVVINTATGLIDAYRVDGRDYLLPGSCRLTACDDGYNPWGLDAKTHAARDFTLLTPHEGSAFSGLRDQIAPSVRVIEDGEVRTVVETLFGWHNSYAYQRYCLPKAGTSFDIETGVYWNEKDTLLKLRLDTPFAAGRYLGQVPFGCDTLANDGEEAVAQKWVSWESEEGPALAVLNTGTHGSSAEKGKIGLTLLRSPGYSAADGNFEKTLREVRHTVRMDQGERIFHFRVCAGEGEKLRHTLSREAQAYNEAPFALAFCPFGRGSTPNPLVTIDNAAVILSCFKRAEDGKGYIFRLYESEGRAQTFTVRLPVANVERSDSLNPFEIKTYRFEPERRSIEDSPLLEGF